MNWNNVSLAVLGLTASFSAFAVALWISLVMWTFRDMRARARDAFAQLLAALMVLVLGPFGIVLYLVLRPRETLAEKYERSLEEEALLQDIEERHICPGCKQPIEPDFVLCPVCHTRLRRSCIHCGRLIHPRWSLCPYCAQSQRPVPGVERAGRVTLLDFEAEGELPVAKEAAPVEEMESVAPVEEMESAAALEEMESVAALEEEAMRNLARAEYDELLVPEWEPTKAAAGLSQAEASKAGETVETPRSGVELFPASGAVSGDATDVELPMAETEQVETQTGADETPRRLLSLFKRR